jgi:glycine cleavage system H protein
MSILFVLLMFLLIISIGSLRGRNEVPARVPSPELRRPRMERDYGFSIPQGYCFHPGHTWVCKDGPETARVGVDSFALNLLSEIDRIDIIGENRWIRQGQKLMTITSGPTSVDLVSPVEGVITSLNTDAINDPKIVRRDPYAAGWIATVKSPELTMNQRNLIQGVMVAPWMQNNITRLHTIVEQLAPAAAADGGLPQAGLLNSVPREVREQLAREFFLS